MSLLLSGPQQIDPGRLSAFVERHQRGAHAISVRLSPLTGGLTSSAVARVQVNFRDARGRSRSTSFIIKHLSGDQQREAAIYLALGAGISPAPRLLGIDRVGATACYLYLEQIVPWRRWPWAALDLAGLVLDQLARLHSGRLGAASPWLDPWDYEAKLQATAEATREELENVAWDGDQRAFRAARPALRRIVAALPDIRRQLLAGQPPGVLVHGDVHPGNALIRRRAAGPQAVLIDWACARVGVAVEDVASWLHSLGLWEPEARRRHDTLLRRYCQARGWSTHLGADLRDALWLAGACNLLAGALRFHLLVAAGWGNPAPRDRLRAAFCARDYLRVIRRADACWRR